MAPSDNATTLLSVGAPGASAQALPGIWGQTGSYCMPGFVPDMALLSTSVYPAGEARAQFTTRSLATNAADVAGDGEAEKRPYRPGELLSQTAKLASLALAKEPVPLSPLPEVGTLTPERPTRCNSEGSSPGGSSDSEGVVFVDNCAPTTSWHEDASREMLEPSCMLGSSEMPTVGSVGHWVGNCKPCAFAFKGCQNGVHCPFCHLCLPGEKQRRRKLSKLAQKKRWQQF